MCISSSLKIIGTVIMYYFSKRNTLTSSQTEDNGTGTDDEVRSMSSLLGTGENERAEISESEPTLVPDRESDALRVLTGSSSNGSSSPTVISSLDQITSSQ
jgi:hypothetical protein